MQQKEISIQSVDPLILLGNDNEKWRLIQKQLPALKLIARGDTIIAKGSLEDLGRFDEVMRMLLWHVERYQKLSDDDIYSLLNADESEVLRQSKKDDTLVFGPGGHRIAARTANQQVLVDTIRANDMTFAVGPAGTGKTYTAVAMAVSALKDKRVRKIVLTRPAVEAGENLGFLPGDLKEKLDPYLQPLYDALTDMLPFEKVADHLEKGVIEIAPLAFMRGRTLDKAFVILDEAQNTTVAQLKMFLTRMGRDAKFAITGDISQVDLPRQQLSGLLYAQKNLKDIEGIGMVQLTGEDVVRHRLVRAVIHAFEVADAAQHNSPRTKS
jgi:phosphate starvation-inducible PhoH-like protein